MSTCFGCEIQTVYSYLNRTEVTENRHQKIKTEPSSVAAPTIYLCDTFAFLRLYHVSTKRRKQLFLAPKISVLVVKSKPPQLLFARVYSIN